MRLVQIDEIEKKLSDSTWLIGKQPSSADREAYEELRCVTIHAKSHPNTFAWI